MNKNNQNIWIGIAAAIIIIGLGFWWFSSMQTTPTDDGATAATSTTSTSTTGTIFDTTTKPTGTVRSIAESLSSSSRFSGLLVSTGVAAEIAGKGPYTVFAPTDAAFAALPAGTINNLSTAELKRLVEYHVVVGRAIDGTAQTTGSISALSRDALNFTFGADKIARVNNSIFIRQYKATNGVVYLINAVLLPPTITH